jgi:hypothetical protein
MHGALENEMERTKALKIETPGLECGQGNLYLRTMVYSSVNKPFLELTMITE